MKHVLTIIGTLCFWSFIAIKAGGTSFAEWSWMWVLMTPVPMLSLVVKHFNL